MSKFKDKLLRDQDEYYAHMLSYHEWLDGNIKPLSNDEIDELEKEFRRKPSPNTSKKSLSELSLNNVNYNNNPIGA